MSHYLHNKHTPMGGRRGVDPVDGVRGHIHRALEAKGHIRAPQVIINGLGQRDDVQPLFPQEVGGLVGAVAA